MTVKRDKEGFYHIEGAKYVRIMDGYFSDTKKCYELTVKDISGKCVRDRIFYTYKLETLKKFLAQYETEKDLLTDYYIARLEGKHELDFYGTRR